MPRCDVSVVIAAQERAAELRNLLRSMALQTFPADRFEVIVIDDGSRTSLADLVAPFIAGRAVRFVRHDRPLGASVARNVGVALAEGELIILLDGDCLAHPELVQAHWEAQSVRPAAVSGYVSARELTPVQWRLVHGEDWDFADTTATFARVAQTPTLHDPLVETLAEPRPADWAFFWTYNVSVPKAAFQEVGGFDEDLDRLEDVDLGYRLAKGGYPTVYVPEAKALHQPHDRDRWRQVVADRRNEVAFLAKFPNLAVEAVCSYDIAGSREMVPAVESFAGSITAESSDCGQLAALPRLTARIAADCSVLLLGSPDGWPEELAAPETVCFPGELPGALQLLGTRLPYPACHFGLGVVTDYWRQLPERLVCRVLGELSRVCQEVVVLSSVSTKPAVEPSAVLVAAAAAHGDPFWDFAVRVRRELHQFHFAELERTHGGAAAFCVAQLDWPTVEL
jgi:GT2 family glycosyltransferase